MCLLTQTRLRSFSRKESPQGPRAALPSAVRLDRQLPLHLSADLDRPWAVLGSLLAAGGSFDATLQGLRSFPPDSWAPINLVFQVHHSMISLGGLFIAIGLLGVLFAVWKQRICRTRWLLWVFVLSILMTQLATLSSWWTAEFGRQPWIV